MELPRAAQLVAFSSTFWSTISRCPTGADDDSVVETADQPHVAVCDAPSRRAITRQPGLVRGSGPAVSEGGIVLDFGKSAIDSAELIPNPLDG